MKKKLIKCVCLLYVVFALNTYGGELKKRHSDNVFTRYILPTTAIVSHIPYMVYLSTVPNIGSKLNDNFLYTSPVDTCINYLLCGISIGSLMPELSVKENILVNTTLLGIQTTTYALSNVQGVSLIWSGLTGIMLGKLFWGKPCGGSKRRLLLPIILNSIATTYYAYHAGQATTWAHLSGIAGGVLIGIPLFYNK